MFKLTRFGVILLLFIVGTFPTLAQQDERPKVALVLAGGGAKGAAHIGVLKALEELNIPVDYITGTSMGAYVGGLYATGMSAEEIESFIYSVDWNSGYRDRVSRSQRRVRDKEYEDRYQLTTDLGLKWGEVHAARGVVQGQGMLKILRETAGNLPPFHSFDDLAIPYRSVATDILQLEPVVIKDGYIVDAMMASMSVPGALPPYKLNDRLLVDGGVTNNMPVDVARAMGADVIIAVDISTNYKQEEDFTTFLTVADQLSNYLVRSTTQRQKETLTDDDIYLKPNVGEMETTEFDKMPDAFGKGYLAAMEESDKLERLSLSSSDYQAYIEDKQVARRKLRYGDGIQVDEVVINNNSHYTDELLQNRLQLEAGQTYGSERLEQSIEELYALDRFELVTYRYDNLDGKDQLVVDVNEKSWGPNYLNFRFFLEDDFTTDSQYSIGMSANFTDISSHGAELTTNVEMGTDKLVEAELFTPFFSSQKVFTTFGIKYTDVKRNGPVDGFDDVGLESSRDFLPVIYSEWIGEAALGYQGSLWREFRFGARYTDGKAELSSLPSCGDVSFTRTAGFASYRVDTLDDFSLPTQGVYFDLEYLISHDRTDNAVTCLGVIQDEGTDTVYEFSGKFVGAMSKNRHTLVANLDYGVVESKSSSLPIDPKELGGFLNLSGIPRNSMIGQNKVFNSLVYRYRWFDNDFGLFSSPFYLGASVEYGGVWSNPDLKLKDAPLYAAAQCLPG